DWPIVGGVLSNFTVAVSVAELPALSVAVPPTFDVPSADTVCALVQDAMPDSGSVQLKVTVTLLLFQPKPSGAGVSAWLITGAVLSILTWTVFATSVLAALSELQD